MINFCWLFIILASLKQIVKNITSSGPLCLYHDISVIPWNFVFVSFNVISTVSLSWLHTCLMGFHCFARDHIMVIHNADRNSPQNYLQWLHEESVEKLQNDTEWWNVVKRGYRVTDSTQQRFFKMRLASKVEVFCLLRCCWRSQVSMSFTVWCWYTWLHGITMTSLHQTRWLALGVMKMNVNAKERVLVCSFELKIYIFTVEFLDLTIWTHFCEKQFFFLFQILIVMII